MSSGRNVIVIGASAGGVSALQSLVSQLSPVLDATLFVVLHVPSDSESLLPQILDRAGPLPARQAVDGDIFERGTIYVAPPDHHLLIEAPNHMRLSRGPRENHARPAVDVLFRSAARAFGPRVVGIVLSGSLSDGTVGLQVIRARGGLAVVQDPGEALFPEMPRNALRWVPVDHVLPVSDIARLLSDGHVASSAPPGGDQSEGISAGPLPLVSASRNPQDAVDLEVALTVDSQSQDRELEKQGTVSTFTCPDCHGALWEVGEASVPRFRCRVGHAFTLESLWSGQVEGLESALWSAVRVMEEQASLLRRMAEGAHGRGHASTSARYEDRARGLEEQGDLIRKVLLDGHLFGGIREDEQIA